MGRDTLNHAIESVLCQTEKADEILVVAGRVPKISKKNLAYVTIIEEYKNNPSGWTAAKNRNIGVKASTLRFVAFLDDDDFWTPNKMKIQMKYLAIHPNTVSIASTIYSLNRFIKFKRPRRVLMPNESVLNAHYGKRRILPSPYYTQTSGIVLSRDIALATPFNTDLPYCEDIWWLHELQSKGISLHQHAENLVEVSGNPFRAADRDVSEQNTEWLEKLRGVDPRLESNYLRGIRFRNAILRGRFLRALSLLR